MAATFYKGDRVIVVSDPGGEFAGAVGEIARCEPDYAGDYLVKLDVATDLGRKFWFKPSEIKKLAFGASRKLAAIEARAYSDWVNGRPTASPLALSQARGE